MYNASTAQKQDVLVKHLVQPGVIRCHRMKSHKVVKAISKFSVVKPFFFPIQHENSMGVKDASVILQTYLVLKIAISVLTYFLSKF